MGLRFAGWPLLRERAAVERRGGAVRAMDDMQVVQPIGEADIRPSTRLQALYRQVVRLAIVGREQCLWDPRGGSISELRRSQTIAASVILSRVCPWGAAFQQSATSDDQRIPLDVARD